MGLDVNSVKFLLWSRNLGVRFDRTMMLGRQGFASSQYRFKRALKDFGIQATEEEIDRIYRRPPQSALYADEFFRFMGGNEVESVDQSDFEQATLLHDLNKPFPEHLRGSFDLVYDGGTLEHIFNYQVALANCIDLLRVGGHMVTITPATGQMGHGFYQFSPELFFRLFSPERGFELRKIVLIEMAKTDSPFYEVIDPAVAGERSVSPARPMLLAVLVRKIGETPANLEPPQQSDYLALWKAHEKKHAEEKDGVVQSPGFLRRLRIALNPYWPMWLRDFRDEAVSRWSWSRGLARQKNLRSFRQLNPQDVFSERAK